MSSAFAAATSAVVAVKYLSSPIWMRALAQHQVEHLVAPLLGASGCVDRVVRGRRLRDAGQHRGFGQRQVLRGLPK